jgi:hypothetical protein
MEANLEGVQFLKNLIGKGGAQPDTMHAAASGYTIHARNDFAYFRQMLRPGMLKSWWTDEIARAMEKFYYDLTAGKRPMLQSVLHRSTANHGRQPTSSRGSQARTPTSNQSTRATATNSVRAPMSTFSA